ncbi:MAG: hypothetical protein ABS79_01350 [Planctomycetes bacterium SCN 63-9]|nr:MAG: hypothetical protein ABS79_01350 [Planctomycetes bacterium SCN 63-9]
MATFFLIASCVAGIHPNARGENPVVFSRDILPILSENCFQCHGPDHKSREADLRLDTQEGALRKVDPVIVAGQSGQSELIERIISQDVDEVMPPPKSGKKLTQSQIDLLKRWIDQGAPWGKHWAFESPKAALPETIRDQSWPRNPIDQFILARLESENLGPSPEASKATLIRRVTLDLTGLPPTTAEVDAFLADPSPGAYEALVDRLLASPAYGERMATDWLDGARYADTNGYQNDFARTMWPWRDWLIHAFNDNQPFDQFVIDQIAGDLRPGATLAQKVATGFNRNNRTVTEAGSIDEEWRVENAVDRVETTSMVFMGLTLGCARCHDHKYDPISQREFYQFYGFFNSVNEKGVYTETRGNVPPLVRLYRPGEEERLKQLDDAIARAEQEEKAQKPDPAKPKQEKDKGETPLQKLRKEKAEFEKQILSTMVMEDLSTPRETFLLKRGRYEMPDQSQKLEPVVPACLPPMPADGPRNRLGLARWLVAPENPLTSRVAVNRFWQHHFGVGLVKTAENFGIQSELPSHPALLDWLAVEFIRSGWNTKAMHRLIVTSQTYRQSSTASPALLQRDPENRLLARGPHFRLNAEVVRDNALAIAGLLVQKLGGPSIRPYQPEGLWEELAGGAGEGPYVQDKGASLYRRGLYIYRKRTVPHPIMATFDAPSREICQVKRPRTNTPLQALELLNDVTYVEAARQFAQLMIDQGGPSPETRITYAYRRALARTPTAHELEILGKSLERYRQNYQSDPEAARKLIQHGESRVEANLDPAELAAYTAVAGVILNLDETVTLE